jgi:hypothetical protein
MGRRLSARLVDARSYNCIEGRCYGVHWGSVYSFGGEVCFIFQSIAYPSAGSEGQV